MKALYESIHGTESVDYARLFHEQAQLDSNKQLLAELRQDDATDEEVKKIEDSEIELARRHNRLDNLAVARKLTLMSEMNQGFVADAKL